MIQHLTVNLTIRNGALLAYVPILLSFDGAYDFTGDIRGDCEVRKLFFGCDEDVGMLTTLIGYNEVYLPYYALLILIGYKKEKHTNKFYLVTDKSYTKILICIYIHIDGLLYSLIIIWSRPTRE